MNVAACRLANQQLAHPRLTSPCDVVTWLGAVQAQDYAAAKWALGQRLPASTDAAIEEAFTQGAILRTHVLRPTWHFVTPADIRWMLALTAPRINAILAYQHRQHQLDSPFLARCHSIIAKALEGGRQLTRRELASELQRASLVNPDAPGSDLRMTHIMAHAELEAIVCSGGRRGKQFTYALLDERAPRAVSLSSIDALALLAARYFESRGPATLQDFAWWSGLTTKDAATGLEMVKANLHSETMSGRTRWMPSSTPPERTSARAYLLPNYDEYLVAYRHRQNEDGRGNLLFSHTIVLDGKIAGTWKRSLAKDRVTIDARPFKPLNAKDSRLVKAAAKRYAKFLGLTLCLIGS